MLSTMRVTAARGAAGAARRAVAAVAPAPRAAAFATLQRAAPALSRPASAVSQHVRSFSDAPPTGTEQFEFKAETKKLLDIVAKSLYTDKEVFIRELISNASDACEKLRFLQTSATLGDIHNEDLPLRVKVSADEAERTFTIEDSGVGMTREELVDHLGTIAKSGSLDFLQKGDSDASKIIGQFGVGFYSTFVVADKVDVYTKTCDPSKGEQGYLWSSDGSGSYTIQEVPDVPRGTKIILRLKDDATEFAKPANVLKCAEKFSSFIDFPIFMQDGLEEKEITKQDALWMKTSATDEEHETFYKYLSGNSYGKPYYSLMYQTDAPLSIKTALYFPDPDSAPSKMFSRDPEVGIALHSRRVLVKKNADGVVPKWLHWVRGVVDCEDMPMNISRESMQDTRLMEKLSMAVVRKILRFLIQHAKRDPEKYNAWFKGYSYYLKAGIIEDKEANNGRHKDDLLKLMRFECSNKEKSDLISLEEYVQTAKDGQKNIYYFCCPDRQTGMNSPYMEQFIQRNRNVVLLYEDIDEYVVSAIEGFKDYKLISVDSADKDFELELDPPAEEDNKDQRKLSESEQKQVQDFIKSVLKERVQEVKFSDRLVSSPAIVTSIISPHMRKMMANLMKGKEDTGMGNIPMTLELSAKHHILTTLHTILETNEPVARIAVEQMFDNACIAAGTLDDPRVLLARLGKVLEMFVYQGAGFDYAKNEYTVASTESAAPVGEAKPDEAAKQAPPKAEAPSSGGSRFEEVKP